MALDFIAWAPEVSLCAILLVLLFYGTGPAVSTVSEVWWAPTSPNTRNSPKLKGGSVFLTQRASAGSEDSLGVVSNDKEESGGSSTGKAIDARMSSAAQPDAGPYAVTAHLSVWAVVWCLLAAWLMYNSPMPTLQAGGVFCRDSFTMGVSTALYLFASVAILAATSWYNCAKIVHPEYILLVLLSVFGQHLLLLSTDLMSLYLCLELSSFALVVLCSLNYSNAYAVEAGMKYFLLSAFSSCLLLLGIGLVYWDTGLTRIAHLQELYNCLASHPPFGLGPSGTGSMGLGASIEGSAAIASIQASSMLGVWLISLGLLWKLAAAPMHFWAADVYQGAWTSVSLLMSTLPKIAVLGFWCHQWHPLWTTLFGQSLFWFSAGSLLIGAIAPLAQVQLKRLMAFSSVGHMGFMLMALVGGSQGIASLWVYLGLYCVTNLAVWALLFMPLHRPSNSALRSAGPQLLGDLAGLNRAVPAAGAAWAISMLSLAGLPPAAGFLGKLGLFWSALNNGSFSLVLLALVATLLSSVYYLRVLKVAYVDNPKGTATFGAYPAISSYCIAMAVTILAVCLWHGAPFVLTAHLLSLNASTTIVY